MPVGEQPLAPSPGRGREREVGTVPLCRSARERRAPVMTATGPAASAVEADVLAQVMSVYREVHVDAAPDLSLDSDLGTQAGLDSLALVELTDRLDRQFGITLRPDEIAGATTPRRLAQAVRRATQRRAATAPDRGTTGRGDAAPDDHTEPRQPAGAAAGRAGTGSVLWPTEVATLIEALARHARDHPYQVTLRILGSGPGALPEDVTYGSLHQDALATGRGLVASGLAVGDRVGLMLPTGRSYFVTYFGVLLAGGVPVPLYPPSVPATRRVHLEGQGRLLANAGATTLVTTAGTSLVAQALATTVPTLRAVRTPGALREHAAGHAPLPLVTPSDLALVQYTSGSTGDPKGVPLTQRQLLANIAGMGDAAAVTSEDVVVSWLPLYHDMGLIGLWLTPLVLGLPTVVLSPLAFLARPASWLEALSRHGGTISAAPNFAYQACVDRVNDAELDTLDLSAWRLAFNGSEPVSAATVEAFARRFGTVGFRHEAMCPAYGLAEAGVGVAFSPPGRGPRVDVVSRTALARSGRAARVEPGNPVARSIVGCGYPLPGCEVRVTGPGGIELPDRHEGRVECRGPSASTGYYANEAATRSMWHRGWLDTGDLGYVLDGEIFLTGRTKSLIIRGGRNLHPEELEDALGALLGLRPGGVAAFSGPDRRRATERLVVVAEAAPASPDERRAIEERVRRRAVEVLGFPPEVVTVVPPGAIRRTATGKIRRVATRDAFEEGALTTRPAPLPARLARLVVPAGRRAAGAVPAWCFAVGAWLLVVAVGSALWVAVHLPVPVGVRWRLVRRAGTLLSTLTGIPLRTGGALPPPGVPAVVVANHASFVDALVLVLVSPDPLVFVTSTDLGRTVVVGSFLRRLGCRFVARGAPAEVPAEVAALSDVVRHGERLVFFPEGSIAPVRGIRPFHLGAFAVAAGAGAVLVPVAVRGTGGVLRPGSYLPRHGEVRVVIDAPLDSPDPTLAGQAAAAETVRRRIAELVAEPLTSAGS